jgi:quercetin dioxygenase-like cupin family protein
MIHKTNKWACLNPNQVSSEHFFSSALRRTANTSAGPTGVNFIGVNPRNLPGLNTLGLTMARIDMDVGGIAAPHIHPRATELSYVVEGQILAAFVDSTTHKLFSQKLEPGDVFVVPKGTVHFAQNIGQTKAVAINALNSQNPGFLYIPAATFASNPSIPKEVLAKSFALSLQEVERIRKILGGT